MRSNKTSSTANKMVHIFPIKITKFYEAHSSHDKTEAKKRHKYIGICIFCVNDIAKKSWQIGIICKVKLDYHAKASKSTIFGKD